MACVRASRSKQGKKGAHPPLGLGYQKGRLPKKKKGAVRGPNVGAEARVGSREGLGSEQGRGGENSAASRAALRGQEAASSGPMALCYWLPDGRKEERPRPGARPRARGGS